MPRALPLGPAPGLARIDSMTRRGGSPGSPGRRVALLAALALAGLVSGCSTGAGGYHRGERGQTAYRIAQAYGIEPRALLESNAIADPRALRTGQLLWIPGATRTRTVPPREDFPETSSRLSGERLVISLRGPLSAC